MWTRNTIMMTMLNWTSNILEETRVGCKLLMARGTQALKYNLRATECGTGIENHAHLKLNMFRRIFTSKN